ncbi:MAG: hypothetical protein ACI9N9_000082 [Enterobacterales bacterium]|jgi:hypothetical protein
MTNSKLITAISTQIENGLIWDQVTKGINSDQLDFYVNINGFEISATAEYWIDAKEGEIGGMDDFNISVIVDENEYQLGIVAELEGAMQVLCIAFVQSDGLLEDETNEAQRDLMPEDDYFSMTL